MSKRLVKTNKQRKKQIVSNRIRQAYMNSGLSYSELAKLTGIKRNTLACWITGRRTPPEVIVRMIEEKVSVHLNGGGEYINKAVCKKAFEQSVSGILSDTSSENHLEAIMNAYDNLPTVFIKHESTDK